MTPQLLDLLEMDKKRYMELVLCNVAQCKTLISGEQKYILHYYHHGSIIILIFVGVFCSFFLQLNFLLCSEPSPFRRSKQPKAPRDHSTFSVQIPHSPLLSVSGQFHSHTNCIRGHTSGAATSSLKSQESTSKRPQQCQVDKSKAENCSCSTF